MNFKSIITFTLVLLSLNFNDVHGQVGYSRSTDIKVLKTNGDTLINAWAGGFNSVQFSEVDLYFEGIKDLFFFDRTGKRISTFIRVGIPNRVGYK